MTISLNKDGIPVETKETIIDVKTLEAQKALLEKQLIGLNVVKDRPDEETLILWNTFAKRAALSAVETQRQIDNLAAKIKYISELKVP